MKRILIIASRPLANDGLTKIEMDVIKYNKELIQFEVACGFGFDNAYGDWLKENRIECHALPQKKKFFLYMKSIFALVRQKKYDSVYIHGNSAMMFMEAIPSKFAGTKVITHCHNTKSDYPLIHYMAKPFFNMAVDVKIGCSSLASKWAYCGKNIITVVNGVDIQKFQYNEEKRNETRKNLGWSNNKIVGHIGRFSKQKNHKKLISIFNEMYKKDKNMRLLLIGEGKLKEQIEELIQNLGLTDVVCIVDGTDVPENYVNAMDIMIVPSLFEGLCLVAVEAQANGLPVLMDQFLPKEARISDFAVVLDLNTSSTIWADKAIEMMKNGRRNVEMLLYERRMDLKDMMQSIQDILLK